MNYQIIFHEYDNEYKKLCSWIDPNIFKTEKEAHKHATRMIRIWWDKGRETVSYTVYFKSLKWKVE